MMLRLRRNIRKIYNWGQKSVFQFLWCLNKVNEYTQIHGLNHIVNSKAHILERLLWFIILVMAVIGAVYICYTQWLRFLAHPTVVSLERDYHGWNGSLPAVIFCYHNGYDDALVDEYIKKKWNVTKNDQEEYEYLLGFIGSLMNVTVVDIAMFYSYNTDPMLKDVNLLEVIESVMTEFDHSVMSFDKSVNIEPKPIMTEKGLCFSVNAPLTDLLRLDYARNKKLKANNRLDYEKPLSCKYMKNHCYMKVDVYGYNVTVSVMSPYEIPIFDTRSFEMERTEEITATYKILETTTTDAVKDLTRKQRRCLFVDEDIPGLPVYSVNICVLKCNAEDALRICGCVPFFYPFVDGPHCTIDGIICLVEGFWPSGSKQKCDCPTPCRDLFYAENTFKINSWAIHGNDIPFAQKSSFRTEILPPRMKLRREVLFAFEDLLVSFGGAITFYLGNSFLTIFHLFDMILVSFLNFLQKHNLII